MDPEGAGGDLPLHEESKELELTNSPPTRQKQTVGGLDTSYNKNYTLSHTATKSPEYQGH